MVKEAFKMRFLKGRLSLIILNYFGTV